MPELQCGTFPLDARRTGAAISVGMDLRLLRLDVPGTIRYVSVTARAVAPRLIQRVTFINERAGYVMVVLHLARWAWVGCGLLHLYARRRVANRLRQGDVMPAGVMFDVVNL